MSIVRVDILGLVGVITKFEKASDRGLKLKLHTNSVTGCVETHMMMKFWPGVRVLLGSDVERWTMNSTGEGEGEGGGEGDGGGEGVGVGGSIVVVGGMGSGLGAAALKYERASLAHAHAFSNQCKSTMYILYWYYGFVNTYM